MDKFICSLAVRLSRVSFRKFARLLSLMICAAAAGIPAVSQAIDDRTYEEIYVYGSIDSTYYRDRLKRDWELFASTTMEDPSLIEDHAPSSSTSASGEDESSEDKCLAKADLDYANCREQILSWYYEDMSQCDENYPRRLEGWTIGIKGIFSFEFKSSNTICREDTAELRDRNLESCDRFRAQDRYACYAA